MIVLTASACDNGREAALAASSQPLQPALSWRLPRPDLAAHSPLRSSACMGHFSGGHGRLSQDHRRRLTYACATGLAASRRGYLLDVEHG